jgi:hypothetical protein
MPSLTEVLIGKERWWMQRRELSSLGTNPNGDEMNGLSVVDSTIRPQERSFAILVAIIPRARLADLRLGEIKAWSGPEYPIMHPNSSTLTTWKLSVPGYSFSSCAHAKGIKGEGECKSQGLLISNSWKSSFVLGQGGVGRQW